MSSPQIQSLKPMHEAIMDFLLANPSTTYREISATFGVTIPWISCIINSDVFQDKMKDKQGEMFQVGVLQPLEGKMRGVVDLTLERLAVKVQTAESLPDLTNTADKLLGRLGYGPKGNSEGSTTNNIFAPALIQRAQLLMQGDFSGPNHTGPQQTGADKTPSIFDHIQSQGSESGRGEVREESAPLDGTKV
jgi:hypothetical protein